MEEDEIRLSFQMDSKDYAAAKRFKRTVLARRLWKPCRLCVACFWLMLCSLLLGFGILKKDVVFLTVVAIAFPLGGILYKTGTEMLVQNRFMSDRLVQGEQTITLYEKGIHLASGFHQLFVPWKECFAVSERGKHLFLLCDAGADAVAINKTKISGAAYQSFRRKLRERLGKEDAIRKRSS